MRLALIDDDVFLRHEAPLGHPERPERLLAARRGVATSVWAEEDGDETGTPQYHRLEARAAAEEELLRVHTPRHVEALSSIRDRAGHFDPDTYYSPKSLEAMLRAAGGSIALVDEVLARRSDFGFGLLRPPGHHACPGRAMGFCSINNVAVAARHARASGADRVLIVDWDVHHGNGTQDVFLADPSVLYISLHEWPQYPGTGPCEDHGAADGKGFTINVPLSAGARDAVYDEAFRGLVEPTMAAFAPDLVLVSAGYDAHVRDPLGGMELSEEAFAQMTRGVRSAVGPDCPVVLLLEGGYALDGLEASVRATLNALAERDIDAEGDPSHTSLDPRHRDEIEHALGAQRGYWKL